MVAAGSITVAVLPKKTPTDSPVFIQCASVHPQHGKLLGSLNQHTNSAFAAKPHSLHQGDRLQANHLFADIVQIIDDRVLTFDPEEKDASKAFAERGFLPPGTKRYKDRRFIFDRVFGHEARQQDVYQHTSRPLLKNLLDGFNATIFAYGATGCGKTHTISGTDSDPGIIYLTMADLFQDIEDKKEECNVDVMVTFLEIYNEEIRDLLAEPGSPTPRGGLQIREDKTVKVVGLVEARPKSAAEVKEIVLLGNSRRTQSPTHANETSSRSHAVLQVHVTQSPRTASMSEERTVATLSIIDLAGSERAAATSNMGQRMVEGANINKSLLALGNCINALCESGGAVRHVPYRNSKLTRLLKFSLGGNCKTVMIVCVAPTSIHFDDTHNTLVYAERATKIKTKVVTRNVVNVDRHVGQYVEAITRLNQEVAELKAKLAGKRDTEAEKEARRRKEAAIEVERAKADMQMKTNQTQAAIMDGAICAGKLSVADAKLKVIRARLAELDAQASSSSGLSPDLQAERGLLQALAAPEEQALKAQSALNVRLNKSNNSGAMFEATLRAVSERRSDKLDEVTVDNVKLDARWRKAEMERVKAEARRDALEEAVKGQAESVVNLIGMLGRCTVMISEAGQILKAATEEGKDGLEGTVKALAVSMRSIAEGNDEAFKALLGHSVAQYNLGPTPQVSMVSSFKAYPSTLGVGQNRVTSNPVSSPQPAAKASRRSSSYGSTVGSPLRKSRGTPRKSLRSSMANNLPYRRVSDKDKDKGKKKGVQWRDEVGCGNIDDGGVKITPIITVETIDPVPTVTESSSSSQLGPTASSSRRGTPVGGSESEWEDERTEDSVNLSFNSGPTVFTTAPSSSSSSSQSRVGGKRPRASHLNPNFLKTRSKASGLGSLAEADESVFGSPRRAAPLGDRNMNRATSPTTDSSSSNDGDRSRLKGHASPSKRLSISKVPGPSKTGRRRSQIGPIRGDRPRRRSSMIPQLSPIDHGESASAFGKSSGPRRVAIGSPAKRPKRLSLLAMSQASRLTNALKVKAPDLANTSIGDTSFRSGSALGGGLKPTWR